MKKIVIISAFLCMFSGIVFSQSDWAKGTNLLYANPITTNVGIGTTSPYYKLDVVNSTVNTKVLLLGSASTNIAGSSFLRIFAQDKGIFDVGYFTNNSGYFRTRLGINYAINGTNGSLQYALLGTKYAPVIELNADNGSVSLFGENGTGTNNRTPIHNLGLFVSGNGNVGIGTTNPDVKLTVNGNIKAERVDIIADVPASDYVFEEDYKLLSLKELESFVKAAKHLPEVPSAAEFKETGYSIGQMDDLLLRKVEELTLYIIEQQKLIEQLQEKVELLEKN